MDSTGCIDPPHKIAHDMSRGTDPPSLKEIRDAEDAKCNAGMKNPAQVCERWKELVDAMEPVRSALLQAYSEHSDLQQLPLAIGRDPVK